MNAPDPAERAPRPVTTPLGGGLSARLTALLVAGALVAVMWIGMSDRSTPPAVPIPIAQARPSTAPATGSAPEPSPAADVSPSPLATPRPTATPSDRYVATGTIGGEVFRAPLDEIKDGHLTGQYWLRDRPQGDDLAYEIVQLEKVEPWNFSQVATVGAWSHSLAELAANHRGGVEPVTARIQARPGWWGGPRPIRRGYELRVSVRLTFDDVAVVYFDMQLGKTRPTMGDDGIFDRMIWGTPGVESRSVSR